MGGSGPAAAARKPVCISGGFTHCPLYCILSSASRAFTVLVHQRPPEAARCRAATCSMKARSRSRSSASRSAHSAACLRATAGQKAAHS